MTPKPRLSVRTYSGEAKENTTVTKAKVSHTSPIIYSLLMDIQKRSKAVALARTRAESHLDYDSGPDPLDLLS
jgi:hypothetical protein